MICAGPVFSFGAIAVMVKDRLGATERDLALVSVSGNVGLWTNVVGGLVFDKLGPRPTMLAGGVMAGMGYTAMCLALLYRWPSPVAALAWFAVGHGSGWIYISTLFSNLKNFAPQERGFVVGAMACFFGASAAINVALLNGCIGGQVGADKACSHGLLGGDVVSYMAMLALVVPCVTIIGAMLTSVHEGHTPAAGDLAGRRFGALLAGALTVVAFICGSNYYAMAIDATIRQWSSIVLVALLSLFMFVPMGASPVERFTTEAAAPDPKQAIKDNGVSTNVPPPSLGPLEAVRTCRFWALFTAFGITVGADIMTLNLLASLVKSRGMMPMVAYFCVIVVMGCDTYLRFLSGFSVGKGVSPTGLLVCGPILMILGMVLLASSHSVGALYVACVLIGASDGIMWGLGPLLAGMAFGLRSAGRNFGFVVLGAACFSLLLSFGLEPTVYQAHTPPDAKVCTGHGCFGATLWVSAGLGLVGTAAAVVLHWQMRPPNRSEEPSPAKPAVDPEESPPVDKEEVIQSPESMYAQQENEPFLKEKWPGDVALRLRA